MEHYKFSKAADDISAPIEPYPKETSRLIPAMKAYLHGRKLSYATARANYWYPTEKVRERDKVPRIVIPCVNSINRPYWQARAMMSHDLRYRSARGGRFGSIVVVWPVDSKTIAGFYDRPSRNRELPVVLCEGPMDALAAAGEGYLSVATMGALFSNYALQYIDKNIDITVPVVVVPDLDMPEFGPNNVSLLSSSGRKAVMRMPDGEKDLAKMKPEERERLLRI